MPTTRCVQTTAPCSALAGTERAVREGPASALRTSRPTPSAAGQAVWPVSRPCRTRFKVDRERRKKKTTTRGMRAGGFSDVKLATADVQQLVEQVPLLQPVTVGCSITSERSKHRQRPRSVMLCRTSRPCRSFRRLWPVPSTSSRSVGRSGSCTQGLTVVGCDTG